MGQQLDISQLQFIGTGIQYPFIFDSSTGGVAVSSGEDRINQSIYMILTTPKGRRLFNPEFGSDIMYAFFENELDTDLLQYYIQDALTTWEKRIQVTSINIVPDPDTPHLLNVYIYYNINQTNVAGNYVFPFFTLPFMYGYGEAQGF